MIDRVVSLTSSILLFIMTNKWNFSYLRNGVEAGKEGTWCLQLLEQERPVDTPAEADKPLTPPLGG